jgi:DNA-binding LacI/PurR family transcriptional regulator
MPQRQLRRRTGVFMQKPANWDRPLPAEAPRSQTRRLTARQVAAEAGVSISAVSRTFTDGASVSPATRARVLSAARTLGYRPNVLAQSLMTGRTRLIGLVSNNFDNPAFMEIFDQFTRLLQQRGLRPLLANLFLHYAFDSWMGKHYPGVAFERYADDVICHCESERQALELRQALERRMQACKLELHPQKTQIAYCRDGKRLSEVQV